MQILFLAQIIPYPPDAGPKIKTWNVLRYLVESGHRVTLVSYVRPEEMAAVPTLKALCAEVFVVPIRRSRLLEPWYWLKSLWNRRPFLVERDDRKEFSELMTRLVSERHFDVIHADQITMAQFALGAIKDASDSPSLVFDAHNAVWVILDRAAQNAKWFLKPILGYEARQMKQYEGNLLNLFHHTLAVSDVDRLYLEEAGKQKNPGNRISPVAVIPIAIDTQELKPVQRLPGSLNIVTLGTLHYPPNAEGIRWFIREVFPKIKASVPGATLTIIGKRPPKDFIDLADQEPGTYQVTGYVPDLTPWLEKAGVLVVPVLVGGGMRVRILEAFARAVPVVTTTVGLEGIHASIGEDVLVEDDPAEFAAAVVRVLENKTLQDALSSRCRRLVEERYDWKVVLKELREVYTSIEQQRTNRAELPEVASSQALEQINV